MTINLSHIRSAIETTKAEPPHLRARTLEANTPAWISEVLQTMPSPMEVAAAILAMKDGEYINFVVLGVAEAYLQESTVYNALVVTLNRHSPHLPNHVLVQLLAQTRNSSCAGALASYAVAFIEMNPSESIEALDVLSEVDPQLALTTASELSKLNLAARPQLEELMAELS